MDTSGEKYSKAKVLTVREIPLGICIIIFVLLAALCPKCVGNPLKLINAGTLITLTGLLLATTGIKESGKLENIARRILHRIHNERQLATALVGLSVVLSMILTNDIALFIIIPMTLNFQRLVKNDLSKLIILEAIAVNVGSTLTPIGNPQNIFLWRLYDIPFFGFILAMAPAFAVMSVILFILTIILFRTKRIELIDVENPVSTDEKLFYISFALLLVFILAVELNVHYMAVWGIFAVYLLFYRRIILKTDWLLLVLFAFIFVDFGAITKIPYIAEVVQRIEPYNPKNIYLISAGLSQIISNVPATVFISKFTSNWKAIAYGANVGGNGLIIGSLANIIAIRIARNSRLWVEFHKYSIPYFIISGVSIYFLLTAIL